MIDSLEYPSKNRRRDTMTVARKLGIMVFCAVPAVIGGGIVFAIFHSLMPVFIYEIILVLAAGAFISK